MNTNAVKAGYFRYGDLAYNSLFSKWISAREIILYVHVLILLFICMT